MRSGTGVESPQDDIGDALRGEDVATDHPRVFRGRKQGAFRNDHLDWVEAALVERDVLWDEAAQAVEDRGTCDRTGGVEVAPEFGACSGEVENRTAVPAVNGDFQHDGAAVVQKILR